MSPRANGTVTSSQRHSIGRIAVGVILVAAAGVAVLAGRTSDGPNAWVARDAIPEHGVVDPTRFELAPVSVPDPAVLWPVSVPPEGQAARTIAAGAPVLAADLTGADDHRRVTLPVEPANLPAELAPGDVIDVWGTAGGTPLVAAAVVQSVSPPDIGPGRVEIAVPAAEVGAAVRAAATDRLVLVRLP